jgi:organic hydroperoxide reductase OsmC/OhrA
MSRPFFLATRSPEIAGPISFASTLTSARAAIASIVVKRRWNKPESVMAAVLQFGDAERYCACETSRTDLWSQGALALAALAGLFSSMSEHKVTLRWERAGSEFSYQKYPRDHTWSFDGGLTMTATAAPAYLGNPANVDPEEAFVASLSSCHMLTLLAIACKQNFVLDSYVDEAVGHMEKNAEGKMAITRVELHPKITWSGDKTPSTEELEKLHHAAHDNCFIANSVKTEVTVKKRVG